MTLDQFFKKEALRIFERGNIKALARGWFVVGDKPGTIFTEKDRKQMDDFVKENQN